ncbi:MAG TPA: hypothetical protein VK034_20115 [Enhygromyxa sp.]|nr:hypothetical protein [Enhygromyxa sp.]
MPSPLPTARLAWYALGRFWTKGEQLFDAGYFVHLEPLIDAEMFVPGQPIGAAAAHFTFCAEPFDSQAIQGSPLSVAVDSVGSFSLYYQREPAARFTDPSSFARGRCIARFRRPFKVVAVREGDLLLDTFSADLIESTPFQHRGRTHDLGEVLAGITQWGVATGSTGESQATFVGSAIAVGR